MEWDRPEAAEQVGGEVSVEEAVVGEGWEVIVPVPGQVGNASARDVGLKHPIK